MAEPFKNLLNAAVVADMSDRLRKAWPRFDAKRFETLALDGLDELEMKARAMHLCTALEGTLPGDFKLSADILRKAIEGGLAKWALWPVGEYVSRHGLGHPDRALEVLHALTQNFTAEWAIRPFILQHPELTFATLARWVADPSEHVRRLVSEGSRPRLPWGLQLKPLIADPTPTLPLLEALMDDDSDYVRKSVANHLNDIAKDHPHLVADWLDKHLPGASAKRKALLRHASRTLIKKGDARVLGAFGQGAKFKGEAVLSLSPRRIRLGDSVTLDVLLTPAGRKNQSLVIDYAVHHVKANGGTSPKVFKGWTLDLAAPRALRRQHAVKPITTRKYFSGVHRIELLINGRVEAHADFALTC
ncbi:DNA alkylation repair protein [Piscinibacter terrae]|uniref:DNA alkylation repair protein n=1 Tax=Piscinibacter terrae TaxID=2496871 RepID=A0A3N7JVB4_9BURK|nr:DNA alkylation repair protein [Albitalea terrae]RQP24819.1 DNA alkylation repair protein [Albitalea terrae]